MTQQKSKNQLYRESGSTLPFKVWLQNDMNESVRQALIESEYLNYDGQGGNANSSGSEELPYKPVLENTTIFGIPKNYVRASLVIILAFCAYKSVPYLLKNQ